MVDITIKANSRISMNSPPENARALSSSIAVDQLIEEGFG
jgi:hypothetical protein